MRIVAMADTHLFHEDLVVPPGDVLVHAGDLCRCGDLDELREAAAWLRGFPHPHKIVVAGNHDWALVNEPVEARALLAEAGAIYLEDSGVDLLGLRFYGSPWQPAYNDWAFNLPRGEALAARWRLIPSGAVDVLITHGPPAGVGDGQDHGAGLPGRGGCADLRRRVREVRPRLHLFGHIHHDGGLWQEEGTTFVNVTTWECERAPTVLDLDPGSGALFPVHIPPDGRSERMG